MTVNWLYVLAALVLLLPPLPFSTAQQKCLSSSRRRTAVTPLAATRVWQNWVDLIRAAAGTWLLSNGVQSAPDVDMARLSESVTEGLLLGAALTLQTIRMMNHHLRFVAPVFFLCGVTLVLGGWPQGIFAVGASWLFAIASHNMMYHLPGMAGALLMGGLVLGMSLPLALNCGLILAPVVLALLLKKRLTVAASTSVSLS
jgi:hypothetical protein